MPVADPGAVAARQWPERVTATKGWSASLEGRGTRLVVSAPGSVVGGLSQARIEASTTVDPRPSGPPTTSSLDSHAAVIALPDGSRWFPQGEFRLDGSGDLPFAGSPRPGVDLYPSLSARGSTVSVETSFEAIIGAARGPVAAVGDFLLADGRRAERLALPAGSRLVEDCRAGQGGGAAACTSAAPALASVSVDAKDGLVVKVVGNGEVAVAGEASAKALGRSWTGQVVAVEAGGLEAVATHRNGGWEVTGSANAARQVWVDVWPVVDTTLSARSVIRNPGIVDSYSMRIQWTNIGFASSQILEAQGRGPGASQVGFDLNKTSGHDAGLGVRRGDRVIDLKGGGDIDSNLAPGDSVDRGLAYLAGSSATIVLRGNFPEVSVALAIPAR